MLTILFPIKGRPPSTLVGWDLCYNLGLNFMLHGGKLGNRSWGSLGPDCFWTRSLSFRITAKQTLSHVPTPPFPSLKPLCSHVVSCPGLTSFLLSPRISLSAEIRQWKDKTEQFMLALDVGVESGVRGRLWVGASLKFFLFKLKHWSWSFW